MDGKLEMGQTVEELGFQLRDLIRQAEASISEST